MSPSTLPVWSVPILVFLIGAIALPGCLVRTDPGPGDLTFSVAWQAWHDDPLPHLGVVLYNQGTGLVHVGPHAKDLHVRGPLASVPVYWGQERFARPVYPAQTVFLVFHPRANESGAFFLSIDHDWGSAAAPAHGEYKICFNGLCHEAVLAELVPGPGPTSYLANSNGGDEP